MYKKEYINFKIRFKDKLHNLIFFIQIKPASQTKFLTSLLVAQNPYKKYLFWLSFQDILTHTPLMWYNQRKATQEGSKIDGITSKLSSC